MLVGPAIVIHAHREAKHPQRLGGFLHAAANEIGYLDFPRSQGHSHGQSGEQQVSRHKRANEQQQLA